MTLEIEFNLAKLEEETEVKQSIVSKQEAVKQSIIDKFGDISNIEKGASAKQLYQDRINFRQAYNDFETNSIDTWYRNPLYGKVSRHGLVAGIENTPLQEDMLRKLLELHGKSEGKEKEPECGEDPKDGWSKKDSSVVAGLRDLLGEPGQETIPLFIVSALVDVEKLFQNRYKPKDSLIKQIKIAKGYNKRNQAFQNNLEQIYSSFTETELSFYANDSAIKNIDDFYNIFKRYITNTDLTVTFAGFMESRFSTPYSSGLVYDLFDGDITSDQEKIKFYEDPNFELFKYALNMHGFKIDPNIPWRAIADVTSDKMWPYISVWQLPKYAGTTFDKVEIEDVFSKLFTPFANYGNFKEKSTSFVNTITDMYNDFISQNPEYVKIIANKSVFIKREAPNKLLEKKWIKWYAEIRNIEKKSPVGSKKLKRIANKAHHIYLAGLPDNKYLISMAIEYVEYALGAIALKATKINKSLTIREESIILIPDLLEF